MEESKLLGYFYEVTDGGAKVDVDRVLLKMHHLAWPGLVKPFLDRFAADTEESAAGRAFASTLLARWAVLDSLDSDSFPTFVATAVREKNVVALCLIETMANGLPHAVEGLRRLNDIRAVSSLARAFADIRGQPTTGLGGASQSYDWKKRTLYSTLFFLTGVAPRDFHHTCDDAIDEYLGDIENWLWENELEVEAFP